MLPVNGRSSPRIVQSFSRNARARSSNGVASPVSFSNNWSGRIFRNASMSAAPTSISTRISLSSTKISAIVDAFMARVTTNASASTPSAAKAAPIVATVRNHFRRVEPSIRSNPKGVRRREGTSPNAWRACFDMIQRRCWLVYDRLLSAECFDFTETHNNRQAFTNPDNPLLGNRKHIFSICPMWPQMKTWHSHDESNRYGAHGLAVDAPFSTRPSEWSCTMRQVLPLPVFAVIAMVASAHAQDAGDFVGKPRAVPQLSVGVFR